ncbi:MAG TPA: ATP-binding protein [Burkholderiales bacterium]
MKQNELGERLEVWDIDLTSSTASGNAASSRIMGLHPDDCERVTAGLRKALESGNDGYEMEYRIVRPDGEVRWILGRGRVVRDAQGKQLRLVGLTTDVTQQRAEVEARLRQAQRMEAVVQVTRGIAHDFNNLLQVIMGNLELLKHRREPYLETVETALNATRNAAALTHRLLAFSRLQPLEPTVLDVNQLIAGLSDRLAHTLGKTIRLETELAADLWSTRTDAPLLETALLNLVVNAREAMPTGGRLSLRTTNVTLQLPVDDLPAGDYVLIEVADTGCGIPREHLAKVFEPFFSTKEGGKGAGLGLSMVQGFVKQSGGQVRIHSRVGNGTSVRVYLPRARAAASQ